MNTYFIQMDIRHGEFEKQSKVLVSSENLEDAAKLGVLCETHDEESLEHCETTGWWTDMYGEFAYRVHTITQVTESDVPILTKYFGVVHKQDLFAL